MISALCTALFRLRNRNFFVIDAIIFSISPLLALILRLDRVVDLEPYNNGLLWITLLFVTLKLTVLYACGFYKRYWRYASVDELQHIGAIMLLVTVLQYLLFNSLYVTHSFSIHDLPRSLPLLDGILSFLLLGITRFSVCVAENLTHSRKRFYRRDRVLIVGAGSAGAALVRDMQRNPWIGLRPVAFVDDNPAKLNLHIRKLPVMGNRYKIPELVRSLHVRKVIIAMPSVPGNVIREILDICQGVGVSTSTLPRIDEILDGRISANTIREIRIEDLLRRDPIQMSTTEVKNLLHGKRVLVTGAGGSIGSELCRQILKCRPSAILLLGHGENSIFNIQQELEKMLQVLKKENTGEALPRITPCIADVRFLPRLDYAFDHFRPDIVFHAAAHKHVPMMEENVPEAVTNNIQGTKNLLDLALQYGVEQFVMISTDKAVNSTNVMGASKRVAEMLVLQAAQESQKPFVVVRFGNVLGSRGSVIPTFTRQIAEGGPVTVTHPDVCRYFMTIPEAVQLVLQASVIGQGGEVFMLDMGEPVKIVDLAKELIQLSGYEVGQHIKIVYTGLRPGEKLFEELFIPGEQYDPTQNRKLFVVTNASQIIPPHLNSAVLALCQAALNNNSDLILFLLEQLVPGYEPRYRKLSSSTPTSREITASAQSDRESFEPLESLEAQATG